MAYQWELGINWNAVYNSNNQAFLQNNFVDGNNVVSPIIQLKSSQAVELGITIFDTTLEGGPAQSHQQISYLQITSRSADRNQVATSPFTQPIIALTEFSSVPSLHSVAFGRDIPAWRVTGHCTIANPGRFLVTVRVQAVNNYATPARTLVYRDDPEMIIEEG